MPHALLFGRGKLGVLLNTCEHILYTGSAISADLSLQIVRFMSSTTSFRALKKRDDFFS